MMRKLLLIALVVPLLASSAAANAFPSPDLAGFQQTVQPVLAKYCVQCHGPEGEEAGLTLHTIDPNLLRGRQYETWRIVDEQLRFQDMPPKDAEQPSAEERAAVLRWIRQELHKTQLPGVVTDDKLLLPQFGNYVDHQYLFNERLSRVTPAPPRIWRLRPEIYDVRMPRLGEHISGLANGLNVFDGAEFKDYAAPFFLDEAAATPLLGNAKKIAERLVSPQSKDKAFKELVDDAGPPDEAKVAVAIDLAFRKAVGRGATDEERQRFGAFFAKAAKIGGHKTAAKAMLAAVLLQPEVLYREELGDGRPDSFGRVRLTQAEIAIALSYALANEPIKEFVAAAEAGQLADASQVAELVDEQLRDDSLLQGKNPRMLEFFRQYFNYPFAGEVFKDNPEGSTHESKLLISDLEATLFDILRVDRQVLRNLLTTREFYVNANYKQEQKTREILLQATDPRKQNYPTVYGLPLDWKWSLAAQPVKFRADERAGVLTHPAWLAAWSGNFENHPVQRGKWIRTHLLGGTVPDVPIGVDARVPEVEHKTFRARLAMATSASECWRCHQKMDPLGVTLERYDHYGRYQRLDAGQPVDASGAITRTGVAELDGRKVSGPTELMEILGNSEYVEQVFVRHVFRYFMGRNETLGDANTLQDAHKAYRESDGSFRQLVASLLVSESFLLRQVR